MTVGEGVTVGEGAGERVVLRRAVAMLGVSRWRVAWAVLLGVLAVGAGVGLTAVSAWLIARASQHPPVLTLSVAAVGVRTFGISKALFRYLERLASHKVALDGVATLRERTYLALAGGRTEVVATLRRGDLLARAGEDVDAIGDLVVRSTVPRAVALGVALVSVTIVGALLPAAGLVLAAGLLLAGVVSPAVTAAAARRAATAQVAARADLTAHSGALIDGAAELQTSGRVGTALAALGATERRLARERDAIGRARGFAAALDLTGMAVGVVGALVLGIAAVGAGQLSEVGLCVVVLTPLASFEGTAVLGQAAVQRVTSAAAARRVLGLVDAAGAPADQAGASSASAPADRSPTVAAPGSVPTAAPHATTTGRDATGPRLLAQDLAVAWPGGPTVARVDVDLSPGRSIAVVGPSGIGKSTVLATLAGLLEPAAGTATIDGHAATALTSADRASTVTLTAEDAHVFATSVLENLRVGRGDLTEGEASALLDQVGLGPWLAGLPDGLATRLGADATTISGGERRRLLLARALASRAPLLLLDEPAEHLDPGTADELVTDLLTAPRAGGAPEREARGILLVTHRLAPLAAADEVLVLGRDHPSDHPSNRAGGPDDGSVAPARVLARGTHAELLAGHPPYADAWRAERGARPARATT
ncbi:thiol reductant ABC exporter subunit CydC [Georgenia sp. Z1344]|uniref:thiol reductant ABC exporter subunit CydC n=1 Tax=Georgenia sp. Z1344 TaxID=3416706 RepID=UPI003CF9B573